MLTPCTYVNAKVESNMPGSPPCMGMGEVSWVGAMGEPRPWRAVIAGPVV